MLLVRDWIVAHLLPHKLQKQDTLELLTIMYAKKQVQKEILVERAARNKDCCAVQTLVRHPTLLSILHTRSIHCTQPLMLRVPSVWVAFALSLSLSLSLFLLQQAVSGAAVGNSKPCKPFSPTQYVQHKNWLPAPKQRSTTFKLHKQDPTRQPAFSGSKWLRALEP